jgi:hypothetical protein
LGCCAGAITVGDVKNDIPGVRNTRVTEENECVGTKCPRRSGNGTAGARAGTVRGADGALESGIQDKVLSEGGRWRKGESDADYQERSPKATSIAGALLTARYAVNTRNYDCPKHVRREGMSDASEEPKLSTLL